MFVARELERFWSLARGVVEAKCLDQAMKELCSLSKPQGRRFVAILQYGYKIQLLPMARVYIYIWVIYNISLTWIKPIWGWFPGREWQGYVYLHDKCGKSNNRGFTCFSPMNSYTRDLALSNRGHHKWPNSLRLHNDKAFSPTTTIFKGQLNHLLNLYRQWYMVSPKSQIKHQKRCW
jgi:hypothetical protein